MQDQRGSVLIFVLVGILILAFLVVYFTVFNKALPDKQEPNTEIQTNTKVVEQPSVSDDLNPDWKSYSNDLFLIKYPPTWEIRSESPEGLGIANFKSEDSGTNATDPIRYKGRGAINFVLLTPSDSNSNLHDYIVKNKDNLMTFFDNRGYEFEDLKINGYEALKVSAEYKFGTLAPSTTVFIQIKPGKYVAIYPQYDFPSFERDYYQIIQTIKLK